jgi:hypothetical protein
VEGPSWGPLRTRSPDMKKLNVVRLATAASAVAALAVTLGAGWKWG